MDQLLQLIFNGLVTGSIFAIGAIGASLVWGVLRIGNFAHGDYMALGAFAAFVVNVPLGQNLVIAALVGIAVTSVFAVVAHQLILKPMRGRGLTSVFIVTVGLAFVMRNTLFLTFGSGARSFSIDQAQVFVVGPLRVSPGPDNHRHRSARRHRRCRLDARLDQHRALDARGVGERRPCGSDRRQH